MKPERALDVAAVELTFIIPAYNEAEGLPRTLDAIKRHAPESDRYEVIVVDHGSTDDTPKIAEQFGATVLRQPEGTVAALRNSGARIAAGNVLVFLDADIRLTERWQQTLQALLAALQDDPAQITGSLPIPPEGASWIEQLWFAPVTAEHIGSGHLIVPRSTFEQLGGFSETLDSGADHDLCQRAQQEGVRVQPRPALAVIHDGYPRTLGEFFRREMRRGRTDFSSWRSALGSRSALAAILFIALHLLLATTALNGPGLVWNIPATLILLLVIAGSLYRFRRAGIIYGLANVPLLYFFLTARSASLASVTLNPDAGKRRPPAQVEQP